MHYLCELVKFMKNAQYTIRWIFKIFKTQMTLRKIISDGMGVSRQKTTGKKN